MPLPAEVDPFWVAVGILQDRFVLTTDESIAFLPSAADHGGVSGLAESEAIIAEITA